MIRLLFALLLCLSTLCVGCQSSTSKLTSHLEAMADAAEAAQGCNDAGAALRAYLDEHGSAMTALANTTGDADSTTVGPINTAVQRIDKALASCSGNAEVDAFRQGFAELASSGVGLE